MSPVGWSTGGGNIVIPGIGFTLQGVPPFNVPIGFKNKRPTVFNVPAGSSFAAPVDVLLNVGGAIGIISASSVKQGATILGMREFPLSLGILDEDTISSLSTEAAHRRQKTVQLNGTVPEELD
jgi:hypothetical protein